MSDTPPPRRAGPTRAVLVAVVLETLLAFLVGVIFLGRKGFWLDEAFTWSTVDRSFPDLLHLLATREGFQILHSLLLWPLDRISSTPEMLRFPSVVAFAAAIPAVWLAGRRLFDDRAGLAAGMLLCVNGLALQYAQEARSYTLAMMLCAYAAAFLAGEINDPTRRGRNMWIAASVLAAYAHGYAVLAIGAQVASLMLLPAGRQRRRLASGAAWIALLASPAAVLPLLHAGRADGGAWIDAPSIETLGQLIWLFAGRTVTAVPVYAIGVGVALLASMRAWRRHGRSEEAWRYGMPVLWLVPPVVVPIAVSLLDPIWHYRYSMPSLGALAVLAGYGLTRLTRPFVSGAVLVVCFALAARGVPQWYDYRGLPGSDSWTHFEEIVAVLAPEVERGDGIVFLTDRARLPFEFQARRTRIVDESVPIYPPEPWGEYRTGDQPPNASVPGDAQTDQMFRNGPTRVWIVEAHHDRGVADSYVNRLLAEYRVETHLWFAGHEELRLLVRR